MKFWAFAPLFLLSSETIAATSKRFGRDYDAYDYYAVHIRSDADPELLSRELGLELEGPLGYLDDHYVLRTAEKRHEYDHIQTAIENLARRRRKREAGAERPHVLDDVLLAKKQELHKRFPLVKRGPAKPLENLGLVDPLEGVQDEVEDLIQEAERLGMEIAANLSIADPIYQDQWHLHNHRELGHDINVTGVWQSGITGKGSRVCIVDDGLDMDSLDLKDNYFAKGSWDYNDPGPDPKPRLSDDHHGTRCAGEIAAARNDICGVGVAYDAKVSGVRILSKAISDVDEAEALNYGYQDNHIYSCSWGPPDNGMAMEGPSVLIRRAMIKGIQQGRGGLGSVFVFALGNGAANDDNCNFDGYTNSIYSVSVGGIDRKGKHPYYSEKCSAQLVVTYSSGSGDAIHTTDVGENSCYVNHGGTSAAGPLIAGIFALMLEANPKLNWRDFQYLTAMTAVKIDQDAEYQMNKALGKEFSHAFGYGKADAWALVEAAKTWKSVKPQAWYFSPWLHVKHGIPQGNQGLASSFEVTPDMLKTANLERIEHVTVTMNVEHTRRGDLSVELRSPTGMVSHIATHRRNDNARAGYVDWTFMSVAHWGESGIGKWTVIVKDTNVNEHNGSFTDWKLRLWGESIDGEKQGLLPMPTEHDDDDHDLQPPQQAPALTTSVAIPTETGAPPGNPTDHIDRPTKPKPTASPSPTTEAAIPSSTFFLPHIFPTFGVSPRTQIWMYGAVTMIIIFLAALGGWFYYMRRKRRWMNSRDDYGFEMVDREDEDDEQAPLASGGARKKGKRRAGELYDAFAEGSSDESEPDEAEMFELGSDGESEDDDGDDAAGARGGRLERYRDKESRAEGLDLDR